MEKLLLDFAKGSDECSFFLRFEKFAFFSQLL